jgi:hypothetical protein
MIEDRAELAKWQRRTDARLATLEAVSDEHVDKINNQRGSLDAIHEDLGEMRGHFLTQKEMLQSLHLTQNEHTAALRELRTGLTEVRHELTEVHVGIRTIVDLLTPADDDGEAGGSSPNQRAVH